MRTKISTGLGAAVGIAAALTQGGCSYVTSVPPPRNRPLSHTNECSDSRWPVVGDVYLALNTASLALILFGAAAILNGHRSTTPSASWVPPGDSGATPYLAAGLLATASTVLVVKSAGYGLASARACDVARIDLFMRPPEPHSGQPWHPPAGTPPPPSPSPPEPWKPSLAPDR